jgi:hypothetical protein
VMRRERDSIFDAVLANPRRFDLLYEVFDHGIK